MEYYRPLHLLFFTPQELGALWLGAMFKKIEEKMKKEGYSFFDITTNKTKLENIVNAVTDKNIKQKENIEIFFSLSSCVAFFGERNGKIGFPLLDSFDPRKTPIKILEDLKLASKEYHLTDFAISYNQNGKYTICEFQLKQYKQKITTEELSKIVKETINKYGGDLGTTNIIFNLQGNGPPFSNYDIDFKKIANEIKNVIKHNTTGHVYIKYNDRNTHSVIVELYPKLLKSSVTFTSKDLKLALQK